MPWKDGTTTARTPSQFEASVMGETFINVDHPDYDGDINAAIAAHTAGTLYVPGNGTVRTITARVDVPANFSIVGDGIEATIIDMASSPGPAQYAIGASAGTGTYYYATFSDFTLRGPRHGLSQTYGSAAQTDCYGLALGRRSKAERVLVAGFESNFVITADHVDLERCWGEWGYHNVRYKSTLPDQRWQDQNFNECDFSGSFMSGIYVENGSMIGSKFTNVHFGFQPYVFLAATGRTSPTNFLVGSTFNMCNWESFGTAIVYSPNATDIFSNCTFQRCSGSRSATYNATGQTYDYAFYCGIIERNTFIGPDPLTATVPGIAWFGSPATSGNFFTNNKFTRANLPPNGLGASVPFAYRAADGAGPVLSHFESFDWKGRIVKCSTTIAAGELVRATARDGVASITADTQIPVGVAMDAATTSGIIRIATEGYVTNLIADAAISIGQLLGVGVSTGNGRCIGEAYSSGTVIPFGVAVTGPGSAGTTFQAHIRMPAGTI